MLTMLTASVAPPVTVQHYYSITDSVPYAVPFIPIDFLILYLQPTPPTLL